MEMVRWGMIGCGSVAEVKSGPGLYKAERSRLVAVTGRTPARVRSYAERHHVGRVYDTVEGLLADPDIDAVYIATPPESHKALTLAAARAGKHVYVEKPMALDFASCQEMIAACERAGRKLFVAYYRRAMPRFLEIRRWIETGVIGAVRAVTVVEHQPPAPQDLSPATLPWRLKGDVAGGGRFVDMGVHTLNLLDEWFGPIVEVHGIAANQGGLYAVEDTVTATWRHAGGVLGSGTWSFVSGEDLDRVEVVGSNGCITFAVFADAPVHLVAAERDEHVTLAYPPHVQQPLIQTIVDELTGDGHCPADPVSAARTTQVVDTILAEYRGR